MGVSGSGKSTVGALLAESLQVPFAEGDDLHPPENIAKMSAGHPLTDRDRWPWLRTIADWIHQHGAGGVITCSALKRSYRDVLRHAGVPVWFLHLTGVPELVGQRLSSRAGHFMPATLLESQYGDLEPLAADESGIGVNVALPPQDIVACALANLDKLDQGVPE